MATLNRLDGSFRIPDEMPVIALRDLVYFPYMVVPLLIGRAPSVAALEEAEGEGGLLLLVAQKDPAVEAPGRDDLYRAGTVIRGGVQQGEPGVSNRGRPERWTPFEAAGLDDLRSPGESRTAFMLRYTLAHPDLHTTIVGTQNPDHLRENVEAARRGPLPPDTYAEAKRRLRAVETG